MEINVDTTQFIKGLKAVKRACDKTGTRPILGYVHFTAKENKLTLFACNGYTALRYTIPCDVVEPFDGFIPPIPLAVAKGQRVPTKISRDTGAKKSILTIPSPYGNISYTVLDPGGTPLDEDRLFNLEGDYEGLTYNTNLLVNALSAFSDLRYVKFLQSKNCASPASLASTKSEDGSKLEAIVLPVRSVQ